MCELLFEVREALAQAPKGGAGRLPREIGTWLHIGQDNMVTVYTGKVEVGQGIRTALTQVVAEELRAPVASIRLVMGDTDLTPFDMGTFGSRTTPTMAPQLRKVAAAARELLIDRAAEQWHVDRATLIAAGGKITDPHGNRSVSYGELTHGAKLLKAIGEDAPTTAPDHWQVAGRSIPKVEKPQPHSAVPTNSKRPASRCGLCAAS